MWTLFCLAIFFYTWSPIFSTFVITLTFFWFLILSSSCKDTSCISVSSILSFFALSYAVFYFFLSVSLFRQEPVFHIFYKCTGSLWMFDSSHLIFVKQCFLLALFGSWFWCYFCSFRFLCLQLVTLKVVSGSYLRILFNLDTEFPRNHNISLSFARKNIQINVDNSYARNSECLFMHANERRYYHTEFVE